MDNGIINSLDKNTRVNLLRKFIGFNELPVSIDQFIHDDYYLGKECGIDYETGREQTYKIWQDALQKIFPDPITTNTFVALNGAIGCVHGDTEILLTDNTKSKIKNMYDNKKDFINKYVYSYDTINNRLCAGKIKDIHCTGIKETVIVEFENKKDKTITKIKCTPDHKFLLKDGYYKEAKDLLPNDRIESLYAVNSRGYYRTGSNPRPLHIKIANSIFKKIKGYNVHHKNENKLDNSPTNLELLTPNEHHRIHYTDRNINLSIRHDKLIKLSYVICEEYSRKLDKKDIDVDDLNKIRNQLVYKGFVNKHSPKYATIDEFTESVEYILKNNISFDYKKDIAKNLETLEKERKILKKLNKSHAIDISIASLKKVAKKLKTYKVTLLAEYFNCSKSKIDSVIYSNYDSIESFANACKLDYGDNHKVLSIAKSAKCKVYDLTIEKYHNYGILDSSSVLNENIGLIFTHNTGKSRCSKIILAYQLHKLLCTKDFYSYNELNERNKPHVFFIGHTDKYKAQANLTEFLDMLHASPYFEEQFNDPDSVLNKNVLFISGREPGDFIGKNVVCGWI